MKPSRRSLVALTAGVAATRPSIAAPGRRGPGLRGAGDATSVRDFGARGDGQTDDTAAFLRAAAEAGEVIIPPGQYWLTGSVTWRGPVCFSYQAVLIVRAAATIAFKGGLTGPIQQIFDLGEGSQVTVDPRLTTEGHPEWWGARSDDPGFDCQPAIQAALRACARTLLQGADYYIASTIKIVDHGHSLRGVAPSQNGNRGATRLMLTSSTADGIQIGFDAAPASAKLWLEHARVTDLTVLRVSPIENPVSGFQHAPCGVRLQWAVTCYVERVETIEHSHGYYITGTVHCYIRYCQALRYTRGVNKLNDFFNGFFLDNSATTEFNSGNASLYIQNCSAFSTQAIPFTESSGIKSYLGFTDTFITGSECGLVGYGLNMNGRGRQGADYQSEDLIVDTCVVDTPTGVGILISEGSESTAAQIHNSYIAPGAGGVAIAVRNCHGAVGVTGCQVISTPGNKATGLEVSRSSGVTSMNNILTDIQNPAVIRAAADCRMIDTINNIRQASAIAAISVEGLDRGYLAPLVTGAAGHHPVGVALDGTGNAHIEVNCTGIRPSCLVGGPSAKLRSSGKPVIRAGPFANGCLASGVMS